MYNKIILAGNLTRDVEIRYTQGGSAIGNTAIATSRKFKSQTGEQKEEVLFVDLTFFGRTAEIANQYLRKGSKVLVDGRLKLDQWTAQDGTKRSKHSVTVENLQMLDTKGQSEQMAAQGGYNTPQAQNTYSQPAPSQSAPQAAPQQQQQTPVQNIPEIDINEDEIPF
ncbi:single-stranded DNA-binding protein [Sulfurovum sp.]|uniref:single-stranded DNA-binding protein n=1 Tax=Sulfurovum sp. TaxID=1969726 RepID=UPI002600A037|nr:single-stranded DNA-binding protein [Sulfurovum sp.]